jgi:shikimate kinase
VIFNLRGTNGTGKSTVAHAILKKAGAEPLEFWPNTRKPKPMAYAGRWNGVPIAILGSYETVCGGMDTITDINDARDLIVRYGNNQDFPIVFYEGLFISHCMGTVAAALNEANLKQRLVMGYLDTPLEECLRRVHARRAERGNTKPFKEQNVIDDYQRVDWNRAKATREGWNTYWVDHTNAQKEVEAWLNAAAKDPYEPKRPRGARRVAQ